MREKNDAVFCPYTCKWAQEGIFPKLQGIRLSLESFFYAFLVADRKYLFMIENK